jgi:hypothetical protein
MRHAIQAEGLAKRFGGTTALAGHARHSAGFKLGLPAADS